MKKYLLPLILISTMTKPFPLPFKRARKDPKEMHTKYDLSTWQYLKARLSFSASADENKEAVSNAVATVAAKTFFEKQALAAAAEKAANKYVQYTSDGSAFCSVDDLPALESIYANDSWLKAGAISVGVSGAIYLGAAALKMTGELAAHAWNRPEYLKQKQEAIERYDRIQKSKSGVFGPIRSM